ncbi:hypothetical protein FF2_039923 [Malus domestica]
MAADPFHAPICLHRQNPIPATAGAVSEIKRWMLQILSEVDSRHRNLVVRRDLKPCKLLFGDDGVLKLVDFGQARILLDPGYVPDENPQPHERSAPSQGAFQPPEVIPGKG